MFFLQTYSFLFHKTLIDELESWASFTHYFWGGKNGGGGGGRHVTHSSQQHLCSIYFFLFIQNIPKRINYIMKYFDSHLYRLCWSILGDGLIM